MSLVALLPTDDGPPKGSPPVPNAESAASGTQASNKSPVQTTAKAMLSSQREPSSQMNTSMRAPPKSPQSPRRRTLGGGGGPPPAAAPPAQPDGQVDDVLAVTMSVEGKSKKKKLADRAPQNFGILTAMDSSAHQPKLKARAGVTHKRRRSLPLKCASPLSEGLSSDDETASIDELLEALVRLASAESEENLSELIDIVRIRIDKVENCSERGSSSVSKVIAEFGSADALGDTLPEAADRARQLRSLIIGTMANVESSQSMSLTKQATGDFSTTEMSGHMLDQVLADNTDLLPNFGPARAAAFAPYFQEPRDMAGLLQRAHEAFQTFDLDKTGQLTTEEVGAVLHSLGCRLKLHEVQALVDGLVAQSEETTVSSQEFLVFVMMNSEVLGLSVMRSMWDRLMDLMRRYGPERSAVRTSSAQNARLDRMSKTSKKHKLWLPDTRRRRWWDLFLLATLLLASVVIPWRTLAYERKPSGFAWILEGCVQLVYTLDAFVFINTCQPTDSGRLITTRVGVIWKRLDAVTVDFISAFPFDWLAVFLEAEFHVFAAFRCLRLLKLIKTKWLFQRSNRLPMDTRYVFFFFQMLPLIKLCFWTLLTVHLLIVGKIRISTGRELSSREEGLPIAVFQAWCSEMFWVWTILIAAPAALPLDNSLEKVYAGLLMAGAMVVQGIIVGKMSVLVLKEDVNQQTAERMRDALGILRYFRVPDQLQREILSYQYHALSCSSDIFSSDLATLPPSMLREVEVYMKMEMVSAVKLFAHTGHVCKIRLVNALVSSVAAADEYIITAGEEGREMYFLVHGFADVILTNPPGLIVATLTSGDSFGEIALLSRDCKRTAHVRALTYCDLLRLVKEDFLAVLRDFSEFRAIVHMEMKSRGMSDEQRRQLLQLGAADTTPAGAERIDPEDDGKPAVTDAGLAEAEASEYADKSFVHQEAPRLSRGNSSSKVGQRRTSGSTTGTRDAVSATSTAGNTDAHGTLQTALRFLRATRALAAGATTGAQHFPRSTSAGATTREGTDATAISKATHTATPGGGLTDEECPGLQLELSHTMPIVAHHRASNQEHPRSRAEGPLELDFDPLDPGPLVRAADVEDSLRRIRHKVHTLAAHVSTRLDTLASAVRTASTRQPCTPVTPAPEPEVHTKEERTFLAAVLNKSRPRPTKGQRLMQAVRTTTKRQVCSSPPILPARAPSLQSGPKRVSVDCRSVSSPRGTCANSRGTGSQQAGSGLFAQRGAAAAAAPGPSWFATGSPRGGGALASGAMGKWRTAAASTGATTRVGQPSRLRRPFG
eukprot:TRINITY_DN9309_c0_g1_i2.p1 TRINITY_DN9309_c0_g1~~TRINITY_DN9309_c0_g1_i2.p1  ORF type:complete len:1286 (+),score=286.94 TRINITY_DN9309_c0_g1_i2:143-4000(+)